MRWRADSRSPLTYKTSISDPRSIPWNASWLAELNASSGQKESFPRFWQGQFDLTNPLNGSKPCHHLKFYLPGKGAAYHCPNPFLWASSLRYDNVFPPLPDFGYFIDQIWNQSDTVCITSGLLSLCASRLIEKVRPQIANYYLGLKESADSIVVDLDGIDKSLKSFSGKLALIQNLYLGYIWGVKPFVAELMAVQSDLDSALSKLGALTSFQLGIEDHASETLNRSISFGFASPSREWYYEVSGSEKVRVSLRIKVRSPEVSSFFDQILSSLGLLPSVQSWYEGLPLSFLFDRIIAFSTIIQSGARYMSSGDPGLAIASMEVLSCSCFSDLNIRMIPNSCNVEPVEARCTVYRRNTDSLGALGSTITRTEAWSYWDRL